MAIPLDEKKAKDLLISRGYVIVSPRVVSKHEMVTQVDRIVGVIGSRAKIAEILGVTRMAVHSWSKTGYVPSKRLEQLERWANENAVEYAGDISSIAREGVNDERP